MAGIDAAFHRLQPVAFLQALGDEGLLRRHRGEFPFRQRRLLLGRAHIGPQHRAALHQRIGLELDLLAEAAFARLRRHVDALAGRRRISSRDRGSAARSPRCGRTTARRRGGRRIRRSGRSCRRVSRNASSRSRQDLHPHRRAFVLRQFLAPAAPASSSCGTSGPSACRGRSASAGRSVLCEASTQIRDRSGRRDVAGGRWLDRRSAI